LAGANRENFPGGSGEDLMKDGVDGGEIRPFSIEVEQHKEGVGCGAADFQRVPLALGRAS